MMMLISLNFPVNSLRITHESIPNMIPFAIEYVNGIITIARKPETTSARSPSNFIFLMALTIRSPTQRRAGVVAKPGIARKIGDRNSERMNNTAVTRDVRPVLPPAATPALDST